MSAPMTRRTVLALLAAAPLAACAAPTPTPVATASGAPEGSGGAPASKVGEVLVYAPGALAATTKALKEAWDTSGAGTMTFEVGHTPTQREQLAHGARPDVWVAANPTDMQSAADAGLVDAAGVVQVARTKLVIITAPGNPGRVQGVADLAKPRLKLLLGADELPIGKATKAALEKMDGPHGEGFAKKVEGRVVSRELGVQLIVNKVTLGEADAGIVFVTDLPADRKGVELVEIPDEVNHMLPLSAAPVTAGRNQAGAKAYCEFLVTRQGQQTLRDAGWLPAAP